MCVQRFSCVVLPIVEVDVIGGEAEGEREAAGEGESVPLDPKAGFWRRLGETSSELLSVRLWPDESGAAEEGGDSRCLDVVMLLWCESMTDRRWACASVEATPRLYREPPPPPSSPPPPTEGGETTPSAGLAVEDDEEVKDGIRTAGRDGLGLLVPLTLLLFEYVAVALESAPLASGGGRSGGERRGGVMLIVVAGGGNAAGGWDVLAGY